MKLIQFETSGIYSEYDAKLPASLTLADYLQPAVIVQINGKGIRVPVYVHTLFDEIYFGLSYAIEGELKASGMSDGEAIRYVLNNFQEISFAFCSAKDFLQMFTEPIHAAQSLELYLKQFDFDHHYRNANPFKANLTLEQKRRFLFHKFKVGTLSTGTVIEDGVINIESVFEFDTLEQLLNLKSTK